MPCSKPILKYRILGNLWHSWYSLKKRYFWLVELCHCGPSQNSMWRHRKRRKDIRNILLKKERLKTTKPKTLNLSSGTKIYINKSLYPCYESFGLFLKKGVIMNLFLYSGSTMEQKEWSFSTTECLLLHTYGAFSWKFDTTE